MLFTCRKSASQLCIFGYRCSNTANLRHPRTPFPRPIPSPKQEACDVQGRCYELSPAVRDIHHALLPTHSPHDVVSVDEASLVDLPLEYGSSTVAVPEDQLVELAADTVAIALASAEAAGLEPDEIEARGLKVFVLGRSTGDVEGNWGRGERGVLPPQAGSHHGHHHRNHHHNHHGSNYQEHGEGSAHEEADGGVGSEAEGLGAGPGEEPGVEVAVAVAFMPHGAVEASARPWGSVSGELPPPPVLPPPPLAASRATPAAVLAAERRGGVTHGVSYAHGAGRSGYSGHHHHHHQTHHDSDGLAATAAPGVAVSVPAQTPLMHLGGVTDAFGGQLEAAAVSVDEMELELRRPPHGVDEEALRAAVEEVAEEEAEAEAAWLRMAEAGTTGASSWCRLW